MNRKLKIGLISAAAVAVLGGGAAIAGVGPAGDDDDGSEKPITGSALDRASEAALQHTGGGRVTETETGDEESYYEVEVTKDGKQTDVQLDRDFNVVGGESDEDGPGDDQGDDD